MMDGVRNGYANEEKSELQEIGFRDVSAETSAHTRSDFGAVIGRIVLGQ